MESPIRRGGERLRSVRGVLCGFTLIELLVVIAIIGLALPNYESGNGCFPAGYRTGVGVGFRDPRRATGGRAGVG